MEVIRPNPGPQEMFLSCPADICIFGGAAGGGKTMGLLLEPIRYLDNSEYGFVMFRRTSPQITNEGGLWDKSMGLYSKLGGVPVTGHLTWRFPSGAKGSFRHLQYEENKYAWDGTEVAEFLFDELPHFTRTQFFYMLSRNRSTSGVKPAVRGSCNPSPGWVKTFLAPWVDKSYCADIEESVKRPWQKRAKSGEIRWFIVKEDAVVWVPAGYTQTIVVGPVTRSIPAKSICFIQSSVFDNPKLLDADPEYLVNLMSLPEVEQQRLLFGNWDIFEGLYFDEFADHRHLIFPDPSILKNCKFVGAFDWGYDAPCCFLLAAVTNQGTVHIIDELYERQLENEEMASRILAKLLRWGVNPADCPIAADPSMWNPKRYGPQTRKADVEDFWRAKLRFIKAENARRPGWNQVRSYLHLPGRLRFWRGCCPNLVRTLPEQKFATKGDLEDLDTEGEDHAVDTLRYLLSLQPKPFALPQSLLEDPEWYYNPDTGMIVPSTYPTNLPHALTTTDRMEYSE